MSPHTIQPLAPKYVSELASTESSARDKINMADPGLSQNIPGMSLIPNASSVETFQPSNVNPSIIQYQDEREKLNSALQIEFLQNLGDSRNTSCYEKVAVLLLSWDAKDNDLNTQAEVCHILHWIDALVLNNSTSGR